MAYDRDALDRAGPAPRTGTEPIADALRDTVTLFGHDIRAAVSDVIGGIRLVDGSRLDPETRIQLERILNAGETLADLVDGALMSFAGEMPDDLPVENFNLRKFLDGMSTRWQARAREEGLEFRLKVCDAVPDRVLMTRLVLNRILGNLISNALKHTDQGMVTLSVELAGDVLWFRVLDQGEGFSPEAMDLLFSRGGRPEDSERPGSGLGLHICQRLAEAIGGGIEVQNLDFGGAEVAICLPRKAWEMREDAQELPNLSGMRVLLAEDNETNQIIVRQMLERMGAEVVLASNGLEALEALEGERFDIALIDIEMPHMNGMEVMRHVRGRPDGPFAMPLVALTAYVLRDNREAIYAAGADGIIAKPVRSTITFGRAILRHIGEDLQLLQSLPSPVTGSESDEDCLLNMNRFEDLLQAAGPAGQEEFFSHLLEDLRSVSVALFEACRIENTTEIRAQTHILISLAGAIGARPVQLLAEAVNAAAHRNRLADNPVLVEDCRLALAELIELVEARRAA